MINAKREKEESKVQMTLLENRIRKLQQEEEKVNKRIAEVRRREEMSKKVQERK